MEALFRKRTWAEIDLDAVAFNFREIRQFVPKGTKLCCVVKANAYGHGAPELAREYSRLGADFFAVSNIEEAMQLRASGIKEPVLILGYSPASCAALLARLGISQCVLSEEYGKALANAAERAGVHVKAHIKLDTGMGRIGFLCRGEKNELAEALAVCRLPGLDIEGIFTHFAVADEAGESRVYTEKQYENFTRGVKYLEENGVRFRVRHCANSAAILDRPDFHFDMVRAGIILYGCMPSDEVQNKPALRLVMKLCSVISHIKTVYPEESVSYGRVFSAKRETRTATVPIGYADGFWRSNFKAPYSLIVNGSRAPIIGRVCMDQLMLDVTGIPCAVGDEVTVFGSEPGCTADDIARENGTINYEILCDVGMRVPRAFKKQGKIIGWQDNLISVEE